MIVTSNLQAAVQDAVRRLVDYGQPVQTEKWQGLDISKSPQYAMHELLFHSFRSTIPNTPAELAKLVQPNMPWAEDHFLERVSGKPLNPGVQYKNWPYYKHNPSNDRHRVVDERFTHTYMERFWPKHAGQEERCCCADHADDALGGPTNTGIRFAYGDLQDVIDLLAREPDTRQAYLPVWFPEDTGVVHGGRVPCTLGYHFISRGKFLHVVYYIRSCDIVRHFRDDIYLCGRLAQHVLEKTGMGPAGCRVGSIAMHITSLHCFSAEVPMLKKMVTNAK